MKIVSAHTILYVKDQNKSCEFYKKILQLEPRLHVPGMTEFKLSENHILGLMPTTGIAKILGITEVDQNNTNNLKAELYFRVENPEHAYQQALNYGATELSKVELRNWGDRAGYVKDLDGYVLVFAKEG